ncbi:isocitrate lyase/phosphoenolpyruvate mutase family protein [Patescibacteria group bacterium]|nr:isocitrate lyase/phosphoenolpyruvate mutase family protein [Patescibacteria group bacterium]
MSSQAKKLRELIDINKTILSGGAHNGLSAKIVEKAGYDAIWASGLEIATSHCVPDANILTMSDVLYACKQMTDVVDIPVVVDCDNGFGNAINVMRTVQEFEKIGVAGICIEDNIFPKRNSFYSDVSRRLESIEEFSGKIRAACSARKNPDFLIIARTEAIIFGLGVEEALRRAKTYVEAGADMVVPHSKSLESHEVKEFAEKWNEQIPLVAIPTKYKNTKISDLEKMGYKIVIFANFAIRSAIKAMRETLLHAKEHGYAASVDDKMAELSDIQDLVGFEKLKKAEKSFLK